VPAGCEPYPAGAEWAEPDLDAAAALMRHVHEHPDEAAAVGRRAAEAVLSQHTLQQRADFVRERFQAIQAQRAAVISGQVSDAGPANAEAGLRTDALLQLAGSRPSLDTTSRRLPRLTKFYRRVVLRVQRHHDDHQRQVNVALATAVQRLEANDRSLADGVTLAQVSGDRTRSELSQFLSEHARALESHRARLAEVDVRSAEAGAEVARMALLTEALATSLTELIGQLHAIPYMSDPSVLSTKDPKGRPAIGYQQRPGRSPMAYADFEDVFRGPEPFIRERQRVYLPWLTDHEPVVDIGCGRGEMLDLLDEAGVKAVGIDLDRSMVERASARGFQVELADGVSYLAHQPDDSVGAVFSAQVIEHLDYPDLLSLYREAFRCLQPGGVFIAETVNPHAVSAFKSFWTDLTHRVPIFPEVAVMLCRVAGFRDAIVVFPNGTGELDDDRWLEGEYAVIAHK